MGKSTEVESKIINLIGVGTEIKKVIIITIW